MPCGHESERCDELSSTRAVLLRLCARAERVMRAASLMRSFAESPSEALHACESADKCGACAIPGMHVGKLVQTTNPAVTAIARARDHVKASMCLASIGAGQKEKRKLAPESWGELSGSTPIDRR